MWLHNSEKAKVEQWQQRGYIYCLDASMVLHIEQQTLEHMMHVQGKKKCSRLTDGTSPSFPVGAGGVAAEAAASCAAAFMAAAFRSSRLA